MFIDFDDVFNQDTQILSIEPSLVLEYFNSTAPDGTHYTFTSEGIYKLQPIEGHNDFTIKGLTIENENELRAKLGKEYSPENIVKYSYNSQCPIAFRVQNDEKIEINGHRIALDKTIIDPSKKIRVKKGSSRFYLIPGRFPPPHKIVLSDGDIYKELFIARKPNDSLHELSFESINDDCLVFHTDYNSRTRTAKLNIKIDLERSTNISDYVEAYAIQKAFFCGSILINDIALGEMKSSSKKTKYFNEIYVFWAKVSEIEKLLSLKFNPKNHSVTRYDLQSVEELYQTLVNKVPIKQEDKIASFSFGNDMNVDLVSSNINRSMVVSYFQQSEYSLFNTKFTLESLYCVFFCKIVSYEKTIDGYCVNIEDSSQESPMYISKLNFTSIEEAASYRIMTTEIYERLRLAKAVKEYLSE